MKQWNNQKTKELFEAILALKTAKEARQFFRDLLTEQELIEFGNRWLAARMLSQKTPYFKITSKTGLSARTIARISRWLKNGLGGYKLMIERLNHHRSPILGKR